MVAMIAPLPKPHTNIPAASCGENTAETIARPDATTAPQNAPFPNSPVTVFSAAIGRNYIKKILFVQSKAQYPIFDSSAPCTDTATDETNSDQIPLANGKSNMVR